MRSVLLDYIKILEQTHIDIYDLKTSVLTIGDGKKKCVFRSTSRIKGSDVSLTTPDGIRAEGSMVVGGKDVRKTTGRKFNSMGS